MNKIIFSQGSSQHELISSREFVLQYLNEPTDFKKNLYFTKRKLVDCVPGFPGHTVITHHHRRRLYLTSSTLLSTCTLEDEHVLH